MIYIMSGIPGSGKSTYVKKTFPKAAVVSADHYFIDQHGNYNFDQKKLSEAHGRCLKNYIEHVQDIALNGLYGEHEYLVVDNTNTTSTELAPYCAVASAYSVPFKIITIDCDFEVALKRQTHGVPEKSLRDMHERLSRRQIPKYWPNEIIRDFS